MSEEENTAIFGIQEDIVHKSSNEDEEFDTLVGHLQDIVIDKEFTSLQESFLSKYCDEFENEEENKLVYTDIYNDYIKLLEEYITRKLTELHGDLSMCNLLNLIQSRKDEIDMELFDTLASLGDFMLFKETMLSYKVQRDIGDFPEIVVSSLPRREVPS